MCKGVWSGVTGLVSCSGGGQHVDVVRAEVYATRSSRGVARGGGEKKHFDVVRAILLMCLHGFRCLVEQVVGRFSAT